MQKLDTVALVSHLQLAMYFEFGSSKIPNRAQWICKWLRRKRKDFDVKASLVARAIIAGESSMEAEEKYNSAEFQYDTYAILLFGKHKVHPSTLPLPTEWLQHVAEAMAQELQANLRKEIEL